MALLNFTDKPLASSLDLTLTTDTDYKTLVGTLGSVQAIAIEFPAFTDGRGFSLAVRLRKDLGFTGEIRATGKTMPEQGLYLSRAGFDSVEILDGRESAYETSFKRYGIFYQFDYATHQTKVSDLRHADDDRTDTYQKGKIAS